MRETILFIPEYQHEIRGSLLQIAQNLMRYAAGRDDLHLVVPYPSEGSRWKNWTPEKWGVSSPNLEFVPVLMDSYSESPLGRVSSDWAKSSFGGRTDYYVVLTMRSTAAVGIKRLFSKPIIGFRPEVVNLYGIGDLKRFNAGKEPDMSNEILFNSLYSWNLVIGTPGFRDHFARQYLELFQPSIARGILQRTEVLAAGVDVDRLDRVAPMLFEEKKVRLVYGGRYNDSKCARDYLSIPERLFKRGIPIEIGMFLVTDRLGLSKDDASDLAGREYVRLAINASPVDEHFWAYGKSADLFLFTPRQMENYGLMALELLYLGVPGVFLDQPNVRGLVPNGYPYVYKTRQEAFAAAEILCKRVQNGETLYDMEGMREFIRAKHNRAMFERSVLDFCVELSRARRGRRKVCNISDVLEGQSI